jgi:1,2-diacylglycerol 3-beta-galactosyltransferase
VERGTRAERRVTNVLIAFSDTGGGHRAAAKAINVALHRHEATTRVTLVDPFALCERRLFYGAGDNYARVIDRAPFLWHAAFRLTNTAARVAFLQRLAWPLMRSTFERLARDHLCDVIVSTHPLLTAPLRRVFPQTPIVVVVTDLVTGHTSWYDNDADLVCVPTPAAQEQAIRAGLPPERVALVGVPIMPAFVAVPGEQRELHEQLGWSVQKPTVLLVGGAEGMGPLESIADAIDRAPLPCDIAIVAGRNVALAERLRRRQWRGTIHVYDFVEHFAVLMRASAVVITKAGPGTISEACASGCPLILSGAIPGQETGNVAFVTQGRAGVWAPSPLAVTAALNAWLVGRDAPAALRRTAQSALRLAKPNAAEEIARLVFQARETDVGNATTVSLGVAAAARSAAA